MAVDIGQGTIISFGSVLGANTAVTSGTAAYKLTGLSWSGIERAVADATHMKTVGGKEFVASEIYDPGEISAEILFDPTIKPFADITNVATAQVLSVAFAAGGSATALWSAYGYVKGFEAGSQMEDMQTGTVTIKLSGSVS